MKDISIILNEFGEGSTHRFFQEVATISNGILVDLGVYQGASSRVMIESAIQSNNKIYAVDPIPYFNSNNPNYFYIKSDSVLVGKTWDKPKVDMVFFDSVHAKEQVLAELYYWWDLIKDGGVAILHDTSWSGYIHKEGHEAAGKLTGNTGLGYDRYGGIDWDTPDKAVEDFFSVSLDTEFRDIENPSFFLIHEDEFVKIETSYAHLGMTIIRKKKHFDYKFTIKNWKEIFDRQNLLLSFFK